MMKPAMIGEYATRVWNDSQVLVRRESHAAAMASISSLVMAASSNQWLQKAERSRPDARFSRDSVIE
jgi:hypothetical protein